MWIWHSSFVSNSAVLIWLLLSTVPAAAAVAVPAVVYACLITLFWLIHIGLSHYRHRTNIAQRAATMNNLLPLMMMSLSRTFSYFYLPMTSATLSLLACRSVEVPLVGVAGQVEFVRQSRWVLVSRGITLRGRERELREESVYWFPAWDLGKGFITLHS